MRPPVAREVRASEQRCGGTGPGQGPATHAVVGNDVVNDRNAVQRLTAGVANGSPFHEPGTPADGPPIRRPVVALRAGYSGESALRTPTARRGSRSNEPPCPPEAPSV